MGWRGGGAQEQIKFGGVKKRGDCRGRFSIITPLIEELIKSEHLQIIIFLSDNLSSFPLCPFDSPNLYFE